MPLEQIILLLKSIIAGLLFAAPVGPVGLLSIRRTLQKGFFSGMITGLGAALADAFFGGVAAFGLSAISETLLEFQKPIRISGGILLLLMAWKTFTAKTNVKEVNLSKDNIIGIIVATFVLAITNPATIIAFTIVFANLGLAYGHSLVESWLIVAGVFSGSMLWWNILSGGVSLTRSDAIIANLKLINRCAAMLLVIFALWAIMDSLLYLK